MLPNLGITFPRFPRNIRLVRVLEAFEGDILTEYKASEGSGLYVEKWCTCSEGINRSLIVRTEQRAVAEYLARRLSLYNLLTVSSDGWGFLMDRNSRNEVVNVEAVSLAQLPAGYLPDTDVFHDVSLRPDWDFVPQNFLLADNWDVKLIFDLEKQFLNVAAFAYHTEIGKNRKLPNNVFAYQYEGGFPYGHSFNSIRGSVPQNFRARSAGVAAASPGVLTIDAPSSIVEILNTAFSSLNITKLSYDKLHDWSKLSPTRIDGMPADAYTDVVALANGLGVDPTSLFPAPSEQWPDPTTNREAVLVAGKMIASYYRRLWKILKPETRAEFISASSVNTQTITAPITVLEEEDDDN